MHSALTPSCGPAPRAPAAPCVALKEWAATVGALGRGEQTILLRKGGLREPLFAVQQRAFWLLPTAFHSQEALLKPEAAPRYQQELRADPRQQEVLGLRTLAEVTGLWATQEPDILQRLAPLHIWGPGFLEARLKWRARAPLTLMELRCWRPVSPEGGPAGVALPNRDAFWGCFSWVHWEREQEAAQQGPGALRPVLAEGEWAERQALLRAGLLGTDARQLPLPPD